MWRAAGFAVTRRILLTGHSVARGRSEAEGERMAEPQLIPVFIPALVVLLHHAECQKGRPLTEQEVVDDGE
jgi:hypothetical protein